MKKLLTIILFFVLFIWNFNLTSASSNEDKVNNIMNTFYLNLDKTNNDIEIKIKKLEKLYSKIDLLINTKRNKLSKQSQELVIIMQININNKINNYKKELENQKEEINIIDLLNDNIDTNTNSINNNNEDITSLDLDSEDFNKTYYWSNLKEWEKIKLWNFKINNKNDSLTVEIEFMEYDWYPKVDFKDLYFEDEDWNKIYYDSKLASLWATKQSFNNVIWWKNYTLYWVVKIYYWWEDSFWISLNKINGYSIGRVLSRIDYKK